MQGAGWFWVFIFWGLIICAMLLLDASFRAHIRDLTAIYRRDIAARDAYIRQLRRSNAWLEQKLQERNKPIVPYDPVHIQWLPPSEEYGEREDV